MIILPKIFCLTLKDTPKRREYAEQHFKQHGLEVEFFNGINGKKFGLKTIIPYKDDNPDGDDYFISSGHIGCILSHYMLWQTLMYLPYEEILILEDDVVLCENFITEFSKYKVQLPDDWQYTFVGHCCLPPEYYQLKINDSIITTTHPPMCTHAYMIKKSSIPILLDTNHRAWSHIDIQIQKSSLKQLKHYIFLPPIAEQMSIKHDDKSDFKSLTFDWEYYKNQQV
jgi:GR25 family glycosyltransferase involved in LPS biosynthesis